LAAEPAFQHTTRIYLVAGIDRSNSLFVPLISLSAGMMLGLLHSFSARRWLTIGVAALLSWTSTLIPFLIPAVVVAIGGDRRVRPLVRELVPAKLRAFQWESFSFQSKLWYGNKALHYEIWPREKLGTIEIGLHFEADPLTNARLLAAFRANAKAVRRALIDARV